MSGLKAIVWKLCGVVLLGCVAVLAVSPAVNPLAVRDRLSQFLKDATGLSVAFNGSVRPRFFPTLGVTLRDVSASLPLELGGHQVATLARLDVGIKLLPLLASRVEVDDFNLEGLDVALVRHEDGGFGLPAAVVSSIAVHGPDVVLTTNEGRTYALNLSLGAFRLRRANLAVEDRKLGTVTRLTGVEARGGREAPGGPFTLEAACDASAAEGKAFGHMQFMARASLAPTGLAVAIDDVKAASSWRFEGEGARLRWAKAIAAGSVWCDARARTLTAKGVNLAVMGGGGDLPEEGVQVELAMDAEADLEAGTIDALAFTLGALGAVAQGQAHLEQGISGWTMRASVATNECDPRQMRAALGLGPLAAACPQALTRARLNAVVELSRDRLAVSAAPLFVDDTSLSLDATLTYSADKPCRLDFTCRADTLDLDRYLPAPGAEALDVGAGRAPAQPADSQPAADNAVRAWPVEVVGHVDVGGLTAGGLRFLGVSGDVRGGSGGFVLDKLLAAESPDLAVRQAGAAESLGPLPPAACLAFKDMGPDAARAIAKGLTASLRPCAPGAQQR